MMKDKFLLYKLIGDVAYPMVLFSIQRWEKWATKIQGALEFYPIKYKDVNWKNFWNVEKKV
jgi:hypothetical protein